MSSSRQEAGPASSTAAPRPLGETMAKIDDRRKRLLSMKYNQRSQLNFYEKNLYGPKALLVESLPTNLRQEIKIKEDPSCDHHLCWTLPPERVLVVKKFKDRGVTRSFKRLTGWIVKEHHLKVVVEPSVLEEKDVLEDEEFGEVRETFTTWANAGLKQCVLSTVDFIICLGGDGTLLYTSSMFPEKIPPIMSFHMGSLGFLTPFEFEKFPIHLDRLLNESSNMAITLRHRFKCEIRMEREVPTTEVVDECPVSPPPEDEHSLTSLTFATPNNIDIEDCGLVMNEVVVDRGPSPYLTNLEVLCNDRLMTTVQGDGIIIATPTGSTAYSLAAGASMVHPSVPCMIVTPICPHSLSFRSIAVPAGVEISIRVSKESRNSAWAAFDGRNRKELKQGESVVVTTSSSPVPSINNTGHVTDWFDSLAQCLHWNVRKQQKKLGE